MSGETRKVELKFHPLIERLVEDPAAPPELTEVVGYLGKSTRAGYVRVYASLDLNEYTDVPETAVRHAEEVSEDELEHGGTRLWLDAKAEVIHEVRTTVRVEARFLEGAIAQAHLRKEEEPAAYAPVAEEEAPEGEPAAFGAPPTLVVSCPSCLVTNCKTQCMATCPTACKTKCGVTCLVTVCPPTLCQNTCVKSMCQKTCMMVHTCVATCPPILCKTTTQKCVEPFGAPVTQGTCITACPTRCGVTCQASCPRTRCATCVATCPVTRCATCLVTRCVRTCMISQCRPTCLRTCARTCLCPIERTMACPIERTVACPIGPEIPEVGPFGSGWGAWEGPEDYGGYDYGAAGEPWYGDEPWET